MLDIVRFDVTRAYYYYYYYYYYYKTPYLNTIHCLAQNTYNYINNTFNIPCIMDQFIKK
jgi:hypothetical protein